MSFLDTIHGLIDRRILLNYRIDPAALQRVLPTPFRPHLYRGNGIGGVCMIRFKALRPAGLPAWLGLGSENAAHRFAVEWEQDGERREGVFIPRPRHELLVQQKPRRPGISGHLSSQPVRRARNGRLRRPAHPATGRHAGNYVCGPPHRQGCQPTACSRRWNEASAFFSLGATGYSATHAAGHYHGMELRSLNWSVLPLEIDEARSRFFDDTDRFPAGTIELDCALLMRQIEHEWRSQPDLYAFPENRLSDDRRRLVTPAHARRPARKLPAPPQSGSPTAREGKTRRCAGARVWFGQRAARLGQNRVGAYSRPRRCCCSPPLGAQPAFARIPSAPRVAAGAVRPRRGGALALAAARRGGLSGTRSRAARFASPRWCCWQRRPPSARSSASCAPGGCPRCC